MPEIYSDSMIDNGGAWKSRGIDFDAGSKSKEKFFPEFRPGNRQAAERKKLGEHCLQAEEALRAIEKMIRLLDECVLGEQVGSGQINMPNYKGKLRKSPFVEG